MKGMESLNSMESTAVGKHMAEKRRNRMIKKNGKEKEIGSILENIFLVILVLYPLRHIHYGLDLWDTGYNYANFTYMGLEHMDSMWLFSTYLANAAGHLITKLPMAESLVGMNFYTGLFVSALAVAGYFFCTRTLRMHKAIAFVGEMAAISLCWCPTALLYNYLGYVFFLVCVMLLYIGLTRNKMRCLFAAGICLGANILVRFSNLPQAAMIVAVWAYAIILGIERKKNGKNGTQAAGRNVFQIALRYTVWCLGGYLTAVVVLFGYIHILYGLDSYVEGILRLFAMTESATDYKASSMLMGMINIYKQNSYWMIRLGMIVAAGMVIWAIAKLIMERFPWLARQEKLCRILQKAMYVVWGLVSLAVIGWLYKNEFFSLLYYSYDSMLLPGVLFLMLTMVIGVIRIFHRKSPKEEKLISGMLVLVILLTSIGSNNGVYPSLNNLFIAAPYTLWQCCRFVCQVKEYRWSKAKIVCSPVPAKGVIIAFLGLFLFQSAAFGWVFVFQEATGVQDASVTVDNNDVLKGVVMSAERAEWMEELSAWVEENKLQGREVILYGQIPALSYYLQMPSAFNPWSDLRSYSLQTMKKDMEEMQDKLEEGTGERPVIIAENIYVQCESGGMKALIEMGLDEDYAAKIAEDAKWQLIVDFMEDYRYEKTFENEKFAIWE